MAVTVKTVYITNNGDTYDNLYEAEKAEAMNELCEFINVIVNSFALKNTSSFDLSKEIATALIGNAENVRDWLNHYDDRPQY